MIYTVVWAPIALGDLATLWMQATDKNAVVTASNSLDRQLRVDPYSLSESRTTNKRIMFATPLGIAYIVSDNDRLVTVIGVWRTDHSKS